MHVDQGEINLSRLRDALNLKSDVHSLLQALAETINKSKSVISIYLRLR
jgi:hypothetical protein